MVDHLERGTADHLTETRLGGPVPVLHTGWPAAEAPLEASGERAGRLHAQASTALDKLDSLDRKADRSL